MISPMMGLGSIRFLLALIVVLLHGDFVAFEAAQVAVLTFFYLSGFLMERSYSRYSTGFRFVLNRVIRLLPTFMVVGVATKAIIEISGDDFRRAFTFIYLRPLLSYNSDNPVPIDSFFTTEWDAKIPYLGFESELVPQAWSIGNEFLYYLTVPVLVLLGRRLVFVVVCGSGIFLVVQLLQRWEDFDYTIYTNLLATYFFFGSGYVVSRFMNKGSPARISVSVRVTPIAMILALTLIDFPDDYSPFMTIGFTVLLTAALTSGFLLSTNKESQISQILGKISYPIYLSHMITIGLLNYFSILTIPALLTASTAFALILYFAVEHPLERVRGKVRA